MAQLPSLDSNQWYRFYTGSGAASFYGDMPNNTVETGPVFISKTDTSVEGQRWQIFQLNSTAWIFRFQQGGADAYLGTRKDDSIPQTVRGRASDASAYWTIHPWGDDTWYLTNLRDGPEKRLTQMANSNLLEMDPATIANERQGQKWKFERIPIEIDNDKFSTVELPGTVFTTSTAISESIASSTTATLTSTADAIRTPAVGDTPSSSGLSTPVKTVIGAALGGIVLITLIVLGLFLWRKRKQKQEQKQKQIPPAFSKTMDYSQDDLQYTRYELHNETTAHGDDPKYTKHELHNETIVHVVPYHTAISEAPHNERPVELPGHTVQR